MVARTAVSTLAFTFGGAGLARVLWLHNGASPQEIAVARERAARHAELFVRTVFGARRA